MLSGLHVPFGITCSLSGQLQLTSGAPNDSDPFLQVGDRRSHAALGCGMTQMPLQSVPLHLSIVYSISTQSCPDVSCDLSCSVVHGFQTLPFPSRTTDEARQWIQDEHLTFGLKGPAADVRNAGRLCILRSARLIPVNSLTHTCGSAHVFCEDLL